MSRDLRCPYCRHWIDLEAVALDAAQADLMAAFFAAPRELQLALAPYIGLMRAESRDITPERQLRIVREVRALEPDPAILSAALSRTTEAVRRKWDSTSRRPLQDHNYLSSVLESVRAEARSGTVTREPAPARGPTPAAGRVEQGLAALQARRQQIGDTDS